MKTNRRTFTKALVGASITGMTGLFFLPELQANASHLDFGEVRSLTVKCVSEVGWFDTKQLVSDVLRAGDSSVNQYDIPFDADNAAGYSALLIVEDLKGTKTSYLLDTGWSTAWMDHAFAMSGIDEMLRKSMIKGLIISHDHNDHFWGVESTLKLCPEIPIIYPVTLQEKSLRLLDGADYSELSGNPRNRFPHTGPRTTVPANGVYVPQPGVAIAMLDVDIPLGVRGENVVYVKVKDKGYVIVTGCGHPGIERLLDHAKENFQDGGTVYGCYGGLHIAPLEKWCPEMQDSINKIQASGMRKVACNHCTGRVWVQRAKDQGVPVVQGTDGFRAYDRIAKNAPDSGANLYVGNGDLVVF